MALTQDPTTGLFVDPASGQAYVDAAGTTLSTNPSLTSQAVQSLQLRNQLASKIGTFQGQEQGAQAGQTGLGVSLARTVAGTGGPSVAQTQLQQSTGQIAAGQESQAAGATGINAALARYAAMQNTGAAQAQAAQSAAVLRAQEVAQAQKEQADVLASQANEGNQAAQTATTGANQAGANAAQTADTQATINQQNSTANKALAGNIINGAGSALTAGAIHSDPKAKTDVSPVKDEQMAKLLDAIKGFTFDYKSGGTGEGEQPGKRIGTMADDVKAGGPLGKSMVVGDKDLSLDRDNMLGTLMSAVAYLKKRVDEKSAA